MPGAAGDEAPSIGPAAIARGADPMLGHPESDHAAIAREHALMAACAERRERLTAAPDRAAATPAVCRILLAVPRPHLTRRIWACGRGTRPRSSVAAMRVH